MLKIPALSVQQPWAELIISGKKTIEIRSWSSDYRGLLWLHTGHKYNPKLVSYFGFDEALYKGGYIGLVSIDSIIPLNSQRWNEWGFKHLDPGNYRTGLFAWSISKPLRFKSPIKGSGSLNLFYPSEDTIVELINELDRTQKEEP